MPVPVLVHEDGVKIDVQEKVCASWPGCMTGRDALVSPASPPLLTACLTAEALLLRLAYCLIPWACA